MIHFESHGFLGLLVKFEDDKGNVCEDYANYFMVIETKLGKDGREIPHILATQNYLKTRGLI
jgi:hypothetical protein